MKDKEILKNKNFLLAFTGSVAVYKSVELARRLSVKGARVKILLTENAARFVTPLLLESVIVGGEGGGVYTDTFQYPMAHIELAEEAEIMVIAPATANIIGKLASGIADDLLTTVFLAMSPQRVLIAPAMNWRMYENPVVQENINKLRSRGVNFIGPEAGQLCCGEEGYGRMSEIDDIIEEIERLLFQKDLEGLKIVVTAGPTREYLDPVRFITNSSTGKMGYALAKVARNRGADVTLITGPSCLKRPRGIKYISVETTEEMAEAVRGEADNANMIFMAAAPADFRFKRFEEKLRRDGTKIVELIPTVDIIGEIGLKEKRPFLVGFAAELTWDIKKAEEKLIKKGLDMIILNNVAEDGAGFGTDTNKVCIIEKTPSASNVTFSTTEVLPKEEIASIIIDRALELYRKKNISIS